MTVEDKTFETYTVFVRVALIEGATAGSAGISEGDLTDHRYGDICASNKEAASELALDLFHGSIAIGMLDDVEIETFVFGENDLGMPDDMWEVGDILSCTCCGEGLRHTKEENIAFGESPYPYDNGFGMCLKCGGDPNGETLQDRLGWAYVTFLEARFDICRNALKPEFKEKWDGASWGGKAVHVAEQVKKGAII